MKPEELLLHADFVRRLARSLVIDEHSTADVAQDTFVAALEKPVIEVKSLRAWLSRVAQNIAGNYIRSDIRRNKREQAVAKPNRVPSTEAVVMREETRLRVVEAVLNLSEPYRSAVLLRYYEGFPPRVVAKELNVPLETAKSRIKRGLNILRKRLDVDYGGDRHRWCFALAPIAGIHLTNTNCVGAVVSSAKIPGVIAMSTKLKIGLATAVVIGILYPLFHIVWVDISESDAQDSLVEQGLRNSSAPQSPGDSTDSQLATEREKIALESEVSGVAGKEENSNANVKPAAEIEVIFVNTEGASVGGVSVTSHLGDLDEDELSGSNGVLNLSLPANPNRLGGWVEEFTANKPGFVPKVFRCTLHTGAVVRMGRVILQSGCTLTGYVMDESGRAIQGASVGLIGYRPSLAECVQIRRRGPSYPYDKPLATSGSDGSFIMDCVPTGEAIAWAKAEGTFYALSVPLVLKQDEPSEAIELCLKAKTGSDHIEGIVLDPNFIPVGNSRIHFLGSSSTGGSFSHVLADDEGWFSFSVAPLWEYTLVAQDPHGRYGETMLEGVHGDGDDVVLLFGEPRYTRLVVVDDNDQPIKSYNYSIGCLSSGMIFRSGTGESGTPDSHTLLLPGIPFQIVVSASEFLPTTIDIQYPNEISDPWVVHLSNAAVISGCVLQQEQPAVGAIVELREAFPNASLVVEGFQCFMSRSPLDSCITDKRGRFQLNTLKEGQYYLVAKMKGFAPCEMGPIHIDPTVPTSGLELHLNMGGVLEGTVLTPIYGDALGRVVVANHGDGQPRIQRVGEDGRYRFDMLPPGLWEVRLQEEEHAPKGIIGFVWGNLDTPWNCEVFVGKTTRSNLGTLEPCTVKGRLHFSNYNTLGWTATLLDEGDARPKGDRFQISSNLDSDGRFQLRTDAPGKYRLLLRPRDSAGQGVVIKDLLDLLPGNQTWELSLAIGNVSGQCGAVTAGCLEDLFYVWNKGGYLQFEACLIPSQEGRFSIPLVPAGKGSIISIIGIAGQQASRVQPYTLATVEVEVDSSTYVELP